MSSVYPSTISKGLAGSAIPPIESTTENTHVFPIHPSRASLRNIPTSTHLSLEFQPNSLPLSHPEVAQTAPPSFLSANPIALSETPNVFITIQGPIITAWQGQAVLLVQCMESHSWLYAAIQTGMVSFSRSVIANYSYYPAGWRCKHFLPKELWRFGHR